MGYELRGSQIYNYTRICMHQRSLIKFCKECGQAVSYRIPDDGDTKSRAICSVCHTVHYENPLDGGGHTTRLARAGVAMQTQY